MRTSLLPHAKVAGMTLIEVLVALAIVAIALTAVIKSVAENIRSTAYLQNKTVATWVGKEVLNEVRLGLLTVGVDSQGVTQTTTMLGKKWYWQIAKQDTPNARIKKISVNVFVHAPSASVANDTPIMSMETYVVSSSAL